MASPEEDNAGPAVAYAANAGEPDLEKVEIKSPAKNRYKGTPLTPDSAIRRRSVFPVLFERADKTWWDPKFDSAILEDQHRKHHYSQSKRRFQYALAYIILSCVLWIAFFAAMGQDYWIGFLAGCAVLLVITAVVLAFTFTIHYQRHSLETSVIYAVLICLFCLLNFVYVEKDMSLVGVMVGAMEIIILMYTVIPMSLYMCVIIGLVFSVTLEVAAGLRTNMNALEYVVGRALLHICIHLVGIHIFLMSQARKRSTFLKVGQSIMSRHDLEIEKQLKQRMIHSLMPPKVAEEIMRSREDKEGKDDEDDDGQQKRHHGSKSPERGQMTFRSFHMSQMDKVSILFADIVGFTKMSSNKTAEHLVSLLNDLFGRFDELCTQCGCEKISTLGDCYYCVSGCPEPRPDHARCCIEMGLGMVKKIREFDEEHKEEVNMRVGVHTGSVLCGLVGTRRFKFDVWSNDVTLANSMESEGRPGMVHVSESTKVFVEDDYDFEEGESVEDIRKHKVLIEDYNQETQTYQVRHVQEEAKIRTYFVIGRKKKSESGEEASSPKSLRDAKDGDSASADDVKVNMEDSKEETQQVEDAILTSELNDSGKSRTNVDSQTDANGVSPALLLPGREKEETSEGVNPDLREQLKQQRRLTDQQLIRCIQEDSGVEDYLHRPPINQCTLNFLNNIYEYEYRNHYLTERIEGSSTFASPRVSAFFDMAVSFIFLVLISVGCFLGFQVSIPWIVVFLIALLLEILLLLPLMLDVCFGGKVAESIAKITGFFSHWYPRHAFGAVLASLPAVAVYANFSCQSFENNYPKDLFYCLLLVVSLLHYCNFTMLSSWMKSTLATLAGLILLILIGLGACGPNFLRPEPAANSTGSFVVSESTTEFPIPPEVFSGKHALKFEIILDMILLLLLIWFLNREFEISYRLSFHGDMQAVMDRQKVQQEKEQADWLLHNIIPEHVSEVLKRTSKYCKNHKDVGVIFAKVVNYDDFYDESFEGGREYYRVLNELIGDFEDLFDEPKYKDVEKIKTIGSCLMAASGLNPQLRSQNKDPNAHLYALMDFAEDLLNKLEQFNMEIFNFNFEMAIGFNFGEVTAGVIGTTKLLYDIWGDTVNISSRMYSTGMRSRIQVTEDTAEKLKDKFEFEYRGITSVKGKGNMKTFLLVGKKAGATWE